MLDEMDTELMPGWHGSAANDETAGKAVELQSPWATAGRQREEGGDGDALNEGFQPQMVDGRGVLGKVRRGVWSEVGRWSSSVLAVQGTA